MAKKSASDTATVTHAEIRMYRMGTGDCFTIKFFAGETLQFKMMIDCGTWTGDKVKLDAFIKELKKDIQNSVDLLVVTHEHKDHVYVFDACSDLFLDPETGLKTKKIWMAWTEEDGDDEVKKWKRNYGDKKKALAAAAAVFSKTVESDEFKNDLNLQFNGNVTQANKETFAGTLNQFAELHMALKKGEYIGPLAGMTIVKEKIADGNIEYLKPGKVISGLKGADSIKFYVLGPPLSWDQIKIEGGKKNGDTYDHNKELAKNESFSAAILNFNEDGINTEQLLPVDRSYVVENSTSPSTIHNKNLYEKKGEEWRRIDYDWMNSSGLLALRINSITNNLSLALAIEFEETGRVMLFPGDAEFGNWSSWQSIKWGVKPKDEKKTVAEELLNRTVFYKVAHHLSHNGTAKAQGLDMMIHPDLVAMATLDYEVISSKWKGTMPNRDLIKDLLEKTKGRLIIMNEEGLFYDFNSSQPLSTKIKEARKRMSDKEAKEFYDSFKTDKLYHQVTIKA